MATAGWIRSALVILALSPAVAMAERGALRIDLGFGAGVGLMVPPPELVAGTPEALTVFPVGGELASRYFLGHDFAIGIAIRGEPWRRLVHEDVEVDDGGAYPLEGRLFHSRAAIGASLSSRLYLSGFNWRSYVEPAVGWHRRHHREIEHFRISGGVTQNYGIAVDPFWKDSLMVSLGLGLEHVWDRAAAGVRLEAVMIFDVEPVWQGGVVVSVSYDFYP